MTDSASTAASTPTAAGAGAGAGGGSVEATAPRGRGVALAVLLVILFLTFLDNTIVTVVLANVQSDLHASVTELQWVVSGYALTFASLMLSFGTIGDHLGRKRVILGGVVVFVAGSIISAVAPDVHVLIAGRVVMGVGAAASEPGTLSMIRHLYPGRRSRARALGAWAAVSSLGLALGPLVGSLLVWAFSWRAIFWFNVVLGVVIFVVALVTLPESANPVAGRFDVAGLLLGIVTLGALTFGIIHGETAGYASPVVIALFLCSLVGAVAFVVAELHVRNPVLDVRYFRRSAFAGSNIVSFTTYFGTFAIFFMVALYLQVVGSVSPLTLALDFVPLAVGMVGASLIAGRWVAEWGPRIPMAVGCALAGVGIILTDVMITPTAGLDRIGWTMFIAGVGVGIAMVPVTSATLSSVEPEHSGMAASTTNTFRELGAVVGVAVLGSIVNGQLTVNLVRRLSEIGIPKSYQSQVVSAVTTGTYQGQAKAVTAHNHSISHIVNEVITAAYGAFGHGLDLSLYVAGALLLASSLLALGTIYGRRIHLERVGREDGHLFHISVEGDATAE